MRKLLFGLLCILLSILIIFNCIRLGFQGDEFYLLRTEELFDRISRLDVDLRDPFGNFIDNIADLLDISKVALDNVKDAFAVFNPNWSDNNNLGFGNVEEKFDLSIFTLVKMFTSILKFVVVIILGIPCFVFALIFAVLDVGVVLLNSVFVILELVLELIGVSINFDRIDEINFSQFFDVFRDALFYLVYT